MACERELSTFAGDEFDVNGLLLSNTFFPQEILKTVLSFVSWNDLKNCRLVCCKWKSLIDSIVGFEKLQRDNPNVFNQSFTIPPAKFSYESIPFFVYYAIGQKAFGNNLLKNPFGFSGKRRRRQKFKHWEITNSNGDGWIVEPIPVGSDPLPNELGEQSCFATSYGLCSKHQLITLKDCGLGPKIMDDIQPHIEVSEWYAARFDCGCVYSLRAQLLDSNKQPVIDFEDEKIIGQWLGREWHKMSHTFKDYGPGVRYVRFEHVGQDTQVWAGHYGSKMAGGAVVARIPSLPLPVVEMDQASLTPSSGCFVF